MITYIIIAITVVISILCFSNRELFVRLQFNAYEVVRRRQYYRMLSHGFVHANWWHLFVNMFVLYFFGRNVENVISQLASAGFLKYPSLIFIILYLLAIIFASTIGLVKHRNDIWYNSVGASGAVSAIMFFSIFFHPWEKLYLYGMLGIPGIIFAILYVIYSQYMSRKGGDNIDHDAHLLGALFGFVFPLFIDLTLVKYFVAQIGSIF